MRPRYLALVVLALPLAGRGQTALEQAFRDWARDHVHPVASASVPENPDDADLRSLGAMIGPASVVGSASLFMAATNRWRCGIA